MLTTGDFHPCDCGGDGDVNVLLSNLAFVVVAEKCDSFKISHLLSSVPWDPLVDGLKHGLKLNTIRKHLEVEPNCSQFL